MLGNAVDSNSNCLWGGLLSWSMIFKLI